MPATSEGGRKLYVTRSHLTYQPREGPLWKAQEKIYRPSKRRVNRRSQMRDHMAPDEIRLG